MPEIPAKPRLLDLTESRFNTLSPAERKLFDAAADGKDADCTGLSEEDRVIRADRLSWLCTDRDASAQVTYRGVSMLGAVIDGEVDLEWAKISFPIRARKCEFKKALILRNSSLFSLDLVETTIQELRAESLVTKRNVTLSPGFKAKGEVNLSFAKIGGNLDCEGAHFSSNSNEPALDTSGAKVEGFVSLRYVLVATGGVDFRAATIGAQFICEGGHFISKSRQPALTGNGAKIGLGAFFHAGFKAYGGVDLSNATFGGALEFGGGRFISTSEQPALTVNGANVGESVSFNAGFKAYGGVILSNATIGGNLFFIGARFVGKSGQPALSANSVKVVGTVHLDADVKAVTADSLDAGDKGEGTARLDADVKAEMVNSSDADDEAKIANSLDAGDEAEVEVEAEAEAPRSLRTRLRAEGGIDFSFATIGGNLVCFGSHLIGTAKVPALNAFGAKIDGKAYFSGISAEGEVCLAYANIAGNFEWRDIVKPKSAVLKLQSAKAGTLFNQKESWPSNQNLFIRDFVYDQIDDGASPNADVQLGWLHRQTQETFSSQPYEQLAAVLRQRGLKEDAQKVMIAKNNDYAAHLKWGPTRVLYGLFWLLVAYGYRPRRAFVCSLVVIAIGAFFFEAGYHSSLFTPTEREGYVAYLEKDQRNEFERYPVFNGFIYSLENFVPLLSLDLAKYWAPNANRGVYKLYALPLPVKTGELLRWYLWIHIVFGWVLTTLWVGGLSGLVKT